MALAWGTSSPATSSDGTAAGVGVAHRHHPSLVTVQPETEAAAQVKTYRPCSDSSPDAQGRAPDSLGNRVITGYTRPCTEVPCAPGQSGPETTGACRPARTEALTEETRTAALPVVLQGRYRLGHVIGRGGAAVVYRARDLLLGREVAIKVFTGTSARGRRAAGAGGGGAAARRR